MSRIAGLDRQSEDGLKSLLKAMSILEAFSTSRRSMPLAEICAKTSFPRSTTHRLAPSMRDVGLLDQDGHRDRYRLGIRLFEFGNSVLANMEVHREARPFVETLSRVKDISLTWRWSMDGKSS
jgi:DNA-binding IclR family transcriptional regulator